MKLNDTQMDALRRRANHNTDSLVAFVDSDILVLAIERNVDSTETLIEAADELAQAAAFLRKEAELIG